MAKTLTRFKIRCPEKRMLGSRSVRQRMLIVCGGQETEPNYFKNLSRKRELTATLVIEGVGEHPKQLVERAITKLRSENDFDAAYVVFDRDSFIDFADAINLAKKFRSPKQPKLRLIPIPSGPCFEVWLLLHFIDSGKQFVKKGTKSPANCVESELKLHYPKYEKNDLSLFSKVSTPERLKLARARSLGLRRACDDIWRCTFTDVDLLDAALQNPDEKSA